MKELWRSFIVLLFLTLLTGLIYPLFITGIGQTLFPYRANGSLILDNGTLMGSKLIGQQFTSARYFWGRPSATTPAYNPLKSTASNLGPSNLALQTVIQNRINALTAANPNANIPVPIDLVTASASGLDPDISLLSAYYQAPRVAKARGLTLDEVKLLILQNTTATQFGFLGQTRVNVLTLNMALDQSKAKNETKRNPG